MIEEDPARVLRLQENAEMLHERLTALCQNNSNFSFSAHKQSPIKHLYCTAEDAENKLDNIVQQVIKGQIVKLRNLSGIRQRCGADSCTLSHERRRSANQAGASVL